MSSADMPAVTETIGVNADDAATARGLVVDGAIAPLDGQPPPAQGGNWWPPTTNGNNRPQ